VHNKKRPFRIGESRNFASSGRARIRLGLLAGWTSSQGECAIRQSDPGLAASATREGELVPKGSIMLADDNVLILDHVRAMLERDYEFEIVAALTDADEIVREYTRLKPDVIVLDISLGEMSGIDVAAQLRDSGCTAKIVFLTVHEDADFLNAALGAGGSGYVVKSRLSADLISAINAVLSNKVFVSPSLLH
jgi:CheY-like chemotaxis protein